MKNFLNVVMGVFALALVGCGGYVPTAGSPLPPVGVPGEDGAVIHGRAEVSVESVQEYAVIKMLREMLFPQTKWAATGATVVTYTNVASTNFTIDVANLGGVGATFSGDTLNLGYVSLSGLNDNNLKVCNPGGNTKCTQAVIRVYTTGATAGFVHQTDGYGLPVYAGTLNPSSQVGLNAGGSVQVQTYTIPAGKNRIRLTEFPSPSYTVTSDFANAGVGTYGMTLVVEYVLFP